MKYIIEIQYLRTFMVMPPPGYIIDNCIGLQMLYIYQYSILYKIKYKINTKTQIINHDHNSPDFRDEGYR